MSLGDCLLHLEHHEMKQECWRVTIAYFMRKKLEGMPEEEIRTRYKTEYEGLSALALCHSV